MSEYNELRVLEILQNVLGVSKKIKNEHAFHCPFCHHTKPKLQIDVFSQKWHCWVCDAKGRSLYYLLKTLNVSNNILENLSTYIGDVKYQKPNTSEEPPQILLPREFISLASVSRDIDYNLVSSYLRKRNISYEDIVKYNIGFCSLGIYRGRIIIPSYDSDGKLNYFIARTYYPSEYFKYKNPPISKNIIGFDLQINWNEPIVLCEGVFDAISIKRNAIPLLGKFVPTKLHEKILNTKVKNITIVLDADAKADALKIANVYMKEGIHITNINLSGKDPSEIGFTEYEKISEKTNNFQFSDLIREKLYG